MPAPPPIDPEAQDFKDLVADLTPEPAPAIYRRIMGSPDIIKQLAAAFAKEIQHPQSDLILYVERPANLINIVIRVTDAGIEFPEPAQPQPEVQKSREPDRTPEPRDLPSNDAMTNCFYESTHGH